MIAADPRSQMLFEMGQCAFRLGKVFGAEAERAQTHERRLEFFQLFDRCFFAARMSVTLELRLRRAPPATADRMTHDERPERADAGPEREAEHEAAEHQADDRERDREDDREAASLPVLLRTLDGIAADAAALPGPQPAVLPTLRELLARVASETAPAVAPASAGLRARLAGSGAAHVTTLPPRPRPRPPIGLPTDRSTGPPRR